MPEPKEVPNKVLVSFIDLKAEFPQLEEKASLTLSPTPAGALFVNLILTTLLVNVPESITAFKPNVPTNDQTQPVAGTIVEVPLVRVGAVYLKTLAPHVAIDIGVMVIEVGAEGADTCVLIILDALFPLEPQPE